jgi:hypothetical protein
MLRSTYNALFRRARPGAASGALPPRITLYDQSALPEPLRLPRPGEPLSRICAGIADAGLAAACGLCAASALHYGGSSEVAVLSGQSVALLAWAARDGLGPGGNRSPGKALFGLELTQADGSLPSPLAALCRSSYWLLLPAASLHPFVGLGLEVLLFFDLATLVLTQDARKAGDYMWGCRVVEELPGRAARLQEYHEAVELAQLRERAAQLAPGLLEEEGLAEGALWHTPSSRPPPLAPLGAPSSSSSSGGGGGSGGRRTGSATSGKLI